MSMRRSLLPGLRAARKQRTQNESDLNTVHDTLADLAFCLEESHQGELESNHGGDGKAGCSYCQALKDFVKAKAALARLEAQVAPAGREGRP